MIGEAVRDAAHGVLADPEPEIAPGLGRAEVRLALDVGQVGFGQVGGAAEQLGQVRRKGRDRLLARVPAWRPRSPSRTSSGRRPSRRAGRPGSSVDGTPRPPPGRRPGRRSSAPPSRRRGPRRPGWPRGRARAPRPGRRTSDPGPSRRPPSSGGPRPRRAATRGPSGCPACSGSRSRCASGRR